MAVLFILGTVFSVSAEDAYGTYEEGFFTEKHSFQKVDPTPQLMNGDFSEGFRFWTTRSGNKTNENAKLVTEGDNTYAQLTPTGDYQGIVTPLFICEQAQPGQKLVVLYDWRGSMDFQVYLMQWLFGEANAEHRLGFGTTVLYEAQNADEWNTTATNVQKTVLESTDGNENLYFAIGVEPTTNMEIDTCVDNFRLAILNADGSYQDLEGNRLDFNTGEESEAPEESSDDESGEETPSEEEKPESSAPMASDSDGSAAGTASEPADAETDGAPWSLIIGIAAVVVAAAAVVLVLFLVKKKKSAGTNE